MNQENLFISGVAGCGKTLLSKKMISEKLYEKSDSLMIYFDFHGEMNRFTEEVGGTIQFFQPKKQIPIHFNLEFESIRQKMEYTLSYLQTMFERSFDYQEIYFLTDILEELFKQSNPASLSVKEVVQLIRKRGSIGSKIAYKDFLLKDKSYNGFMIDGDQSLINLSWQNKNRMHYHAHFPFIFANVIEEISQLDKECTIFLEEYPYFEDSLVYSIVRDIVQKKKYKNIHIALLTQSLAFSKEYMETLNHFDSVHLMRQTESGAKNAQEFFHLSDEQKHTLTQMKAGESLSLSPLHKK